MLYPKYDIDVTFSIIKLKQMKDNEDCIKYMMQ